MRTTRTLIALVALILAASATAVAAPLEERFDQTYAMAAGGRFALDNVNGDVAVTVWDRAEVRIQAVKRADTAELLEALRIDVRASADGVVVETRYPENNRFFGRDNELSVEYTVTLPAAAKIDDVDLVNGDLTVEGVKGGMRASLVNGTLTARGLAGDLRLSTVNGNLELTVDQVAPRDRIELESVNGGIELMVPASLDARIEAETVNGRIRNEFGLEVRKHEHVGSDMEGTLGNGAATIDLETVNGRIALLRK